MKDLILVSTGSLVRIKKIAVEWEVYLWNGGGWDLDETVDDETAQLMWGEARDVYSRNDALSVTELKTSKSYWGITQ